MLFLCLWLKPVTCNGVQNTRSPGIASYVTTMHLLSIKADNGPFIDSAYVISTVVGIISL